MNKMRRPGKAIWKSYVGLARDALGLDHARFITDNPRDSVELHSVPRLEYMIRSIVEHRFGRFLFVGHLSKER